MRLRSLNDAPEAFTSTFGRESTYGEAKWRDLAATSRWFVADGEGLVGVAVGVDGWSGHPQNVSWSECGSRRPTAGVESPSNCSIT